MQHFTKLYHKIRSDLKAKITDTQAQRHRSMHEMEQNSENAMKMLSLLVSRHHVMEIGDRGIYFQAVLTWTLHQMKYQIHDVTVSSQRKERTTNVK